MNDPKQSTEPGCAPATGSAAGICPNGTHAFSFAGCPPEGRIPEGWPCLCGATVARWKRCEYGVEHLVAESVGSSGWLAGIPPQMDVAARNRRLYEHLLGLGLWVEAYYCDTALRRIDY